MSILDGQIPAIGNPLLDWWVRISGFIAPTNYSDVNPQSIDLLQKGWLRCIKTLTDRDQVTELRRSRGMLAYVYWDINTSNNKMYQLLDQGNWLITNNANRVDFWLASWSVFITQFDDADISWWFVTITHNLWAIWSHKTITDSQWREITVPVRNLSSNIMEIDMSDFQPLVWVYTVVVS